MGYKISTNTMSKYREIIPDVYSPNKRYKKRPWVGVIVLMILTAAITFVATVELYVDPVLK